MNNRDGAKIINVKDLGKLTYEVPESLVKAAGLLKHKRKELEEHLKKVRQEWSGHSPAV